MTNMLVVDGGHLQFTKGCDTGIWHTFKVPDEFSHDFIEVAYIWFDLVMFSTYEIYIFPII